MAGTESSMGRAAFLPYRERAEKEGAFVFLWLKKRKNSRGEGTFWKARTSCGKGAAVNDTEACKEKKKGARCSVAALDGKGGIHQGCDNRKKPNLKGEKKRPGVRAVWGGRKRGDHFFKGI